MKNQTSSVIFCFLLFAVSLSLYSQASEKDYLQWFDSKIGLENTSIYNGFLDDGDGIFERNKSYRDTQRYFINFNFFRGSLVYENQPYYNILIKYDLFEDELLLNLESSRNTLFSMRPIKNKVKKFIIRGKEFINTNFYKVSDNNGVGGFAEVLFSGGSFQLLKKHKKRRIIHKSTDVILNEYVDASFNFLYFNDSFFKVKSERDFAKIFPEFKKEIKKYRIKKDTSDADMLSLVQRLKSLISTKSKILNED